MADYLAARTGIGELKKYRDELPSAMKMFINEVGGSMLGSDRQSQPPITETDFSPEELEAIMAAMDNAMKDGRKNISYNDYPTKEPFWVNASSLLGEIGKIKDDPARSAMLSLGSAGINDQGQITDTYDFGVQNPDDYSKMDIVKALVNSFANGNPRSPLNVLGNVSGLTSGKGRQVLINTQSRQEK